jgi:hypothetical protein
MAFKSVLDPSFNYRNSMSTDIRVTFERVRRELEQQAFGHVRCCRWTRINVDQEHEVKYWSEEFGVTEEEIRQAVKTAGPMVKDIRKKLAANRSY